MNLVTDIVDRLRHQALRRQTEQWLAAEFKPGPIVFVCQGNQCRSPFAAAVFTRALPAALSRRISVTSAGFVGVDRPSPPEAIAAAGAFDIDLASHRSRSLTPDLVAGTALVVAVAPELGAMIRTRFLASHVPVLVLADLDPERFASRTIRDPMHSPPEVFRAVFERIERCVLALAHHVTRSDNAASSRYT